MPLVRAPSTASGSFTTYTAALDFTDGALVKRFTITNGSVATSSEILGSIRRPDNTEATDLGYVYIFAVVSIGTGTFDILVQVLDGVYGITEAVLPNETAVLHYTLG